MKVRFDSGRMKSIPLLVAAGQTGLKIVALEPQDCTDLADIFKGSMVNGLHLLKALRETLEQDMVEVYCRYQCTMFGQHEDEVAEFSGLRLAKAWARARVDANAVALIVDKDNPHHRMQLEIRNGKRKWGGFYPYAWNKA